MEGTRFFFGVSNAKTVNSDFFTINRVKGGYAGSSCICSDFKIFSPEANRIAGYKMVLALDRSSFIYILIWLEFGMVAYFVFSCWSCRVFQKCNYAWKADGVLDC